ncbi:hypothetical protein OsccyDRAFT_2284 [Leptolyngbyaceae cyanobacterium JSC-12]|nr:hypothetical protein OsccyDRAFT_2284 [Leptolyngbyaceae cyanobacterium JSC-12]
MFSLRLRQAFVPVVVSFALVTVACAPEPPSRYDQVQKETSQRGSSAVSKQAVNGSQFNRYFPKSGGGFSVVPSQEKKGFAEHKVNKGGKNVAVLSINDTISNPSAAEKYQQSSVKIGGFPAVEQGQNGTGVLVGDRFQVKAQSRDPSFTKQDRAAWIQKFDLNGLSTLR